MSSILLTPSERDRLFRASEAKFGDRFQPGILAFHLESTVGVYTYHMWLAFYDEWKTNGGRSTGYEAERGNPVKISKALCSQIISTTLEGYHGSWESHKPYSVAQDLVKKYGLFGRTVWADQVKKFLEANHHTPSTPIPATQGSSSSPIPVTPQGNVGDLDLSDFDGLWSPTQSPKQTPIWREPNTRNPRQTKVSTYYPKAPFPTHYSWGLMAPTVPTTAIPSTPPAPTPNVGNSNRTKSKRTPRSKKTADKPVSIPKEVPSTIGGLPLQEVAGIFERCRNDIMAEKMSLKMLAESLARRSAGTDEAFWKDRWDEWVLKIGIFGEAF